MDSDSPDRLALAAIERLPIILFAFDTDERFVMSKGGGLTNLGRVSGQAVGMKLTDVHANNPEVVHAVRRALRGETVEVLVVLGGMSYQASYRPLTLDGDVVGAIGVAFDVTERRRAENLAAAVLEGSTDAIIVANLSGQILRFNREAERLFGRTAAEMVGSPLTPLIPEEFRLPHTAGLARYAATGEERVIGRWLRLMGLKADGSQCPLDLHISKTGGDDGAALVGVMRDASQAEALQKLREDMIAAVSHEFRTPLAAISLFIDLARTVPTESPELGEYLDVMNRNAQRLTRLVGDLFLLADPLSESSTAEEQSDLTSILLAAIGSAQPLAEAAGLTLTWDLVPGPALQGDAGRLGQVFDNLLSNAVKYNHRGGFIRVQGQADDANWVVSIANSDTSLRQHEIQGLFEPFRRGSTSTSAGIPGTGLGLSIAKKIVERHHGSIALEVHPDQGTTVTVRLPLAQRTAGGGLP